MYDAKILGQLVLMQSMLINLPDQKTIFSFVCRGLKDIPGVEKVTYNLTFSESKPDYAVNFQLKRGKNIFGEILLEVTDMESFNPYYDYLKNFIFMIEVILEEKKQTVANKKHEAELEQRVIERTSQLTKEIEERKSIEKELIQAKEKAEESEKSYKDVVETTSDLITVVDNQGNFIFINHASTYFYGISPEECIGKLAFDFIHPDDKEFTQIEFVKCLKSTECNFSIENRQISIEGKILQVAWNIHIQRNKNEVVNITSIARDITKQKQIEYELIEAKEKAEESNQLKTAFLQNMSHEIRTPLNAISGFSGMLNKPELSEEKRESFVSIIQNSSKQLVSIVSDILTISSLETNQEKLHIDKVCINNIIVDLLAIFKQQSQNQNISLYAKQQLNDKQSEIYTDKTKITQILSNLISNALKFTHEGSIEFGYTLRQALSSVGEPVEEVTEQRLLSGVEVEFYVKDSGIGINPELHEKIFERFRQADNSTNKKYGGTGLGLAISKAFAELLGGKIWVQSEIETGSTFYFTIPYKPVNKIYKINTSIEQNENFKTILVAEDEEYNFLYIEELLLDIACSDFSGNLKLIHAKDGKEAVEIV